MNLLDTEQNSSPVNQKPPTSALGHANGPEAGTSSSKEALDRTYKPAEFDAKPVPWHRQGKWRIAMLIGAIIVVAAVVGGAVGGTVHKNKNNTSSPASGGPSTASLPVASPTSTGGPAIGSNTLVSSSSLPPGGAPTGGAGTGATSSTPLGAVPTAGADHGAPPEVTGPIAHAAIGSV